MSKKTEATKKQEQELTTEERMKQELAKLKAENEKLQKEKNEAEEKEKQAKAEAEQLAKSKNLIKFYDASKVSVSSDAYKNSTSLYNAILNNVSFVVHREQSLKQLRRDLYAICNLNDEQALKVIQYSRKQFNIKLDTDSDKNK